MSDLLNKASLVMVPSGYKEDTVYSVVPSDGSGDLSFTRASNGTRVNSAGLVEGCPWNLVEQSETFDNVVWSKEPGNTVTANTTTSPNGTTTADTLNASATNNLNIYQTYTPIAGSYTYSVYLKKNETNLIETYIYQVGVGFIALGEINFDNGTFTASLGTGSIENVGNGWYRVSLTASLVAGAHTFGFFTTSSTGTRSTFAWGAQLNIGSTAKPYFPTTDRLNVPRLTYQNGGGGCPSLLLEKQSTNLELWSEDLTNAVYIAGGGGGSSITRTANYAISPDGTQNADRLQIVRGSLYVELYQRVAVTIGTTYTFSFWAKSLSGTPTLYTTWNGAYANEVTFTTDWVRYTYTFVAADTTAGFNFVTFTGLPSTSSTADLLVWGVQFEASSYPTSYIPTTSSSATRVADACFKTGISSLIGQTEGVLFLDSYFDEADKFNLSINDGTSSNFIQIETTSGAAVVANINSGGVAQASMSTSSSFFIRGQRLKIAIAYKSNDFALYINGAQIATDSSGSVPSTDQFICARYNGSLAASQRVNELILFKTRLTNAELAQRTA